MRSNQNEHANRKRVSHGDSQIRNSQRNWGGDKHEQLQEKKNIEVPKSTSSSNNNSQKSSDQSAARNINHVSELAANAPKPKPAAEQTGEKEGRDSSSKDAGHGRPEAQNKQEQAGHADREHDGPSHDDKPSQPNKTAAKDAPVSAEKPSQPTKESQPAKPPKAKNHESFYLGLASAVLVAALGLSLSTMPIFFSLPLAAVLFGIGIWLLSYASFKSPGKPEGEGTETDRHTRTVVVATVLLVLQTFIMDVFIFTRMGTVGKHQNAIVITWIIASMIETLAAFALICHHNPLQSKPKDSVANDKHEGKE